MGTSLFGLARFIVPGASSQDRAIDGGEDPARVVEERSTRGQRCHTPGGASEERGADLFLERSDLPAEGWLRHVEALCRTSHVALLGDSHEIANLGETHAGHSIGSGDFEQGPP